LAVTLVLVAFGIWLLAKGHDPEHAARAGGIEVLAISVPLGIGATWLLLRSRRRSGSR
jgi:hypothetical protein